MIPDLPHSLADWLTTLVAGHACQPHRVTVTGGEPAAQNPDGCDNAIWVWIDSLSNANSDTSGRTKDCFVKTVADLRVRVDTCYSMPDDGSNVTDEQYTAGADCLHELMSLIWCALIPDLKVALGVRDCALVNLDRWQTVEPQGGLMSATLSLQVQADCATAEVS